jgi:Ca2+/Na+ antiporter
MTPSGEIRLFFPPIGAAAVFFLTLNIERASSGRVSPRRFRGYLKFCILLMIVVYAMLWSRELASAWRAEPILTFFAVAGIVVAFLYLAIFRERDQMDYEITQFTASAQKRSAGSRIFAWVVIIWGIAGLIGGIAAIVAHAIPHQ